MIKKEESIEAFNALSDTFYDHPMYFPLFWLEEGAYLDDENADLLKDLVRRLVGFCLVLFQAHVSKNV